MQNLKKFRKFGGRGGGEEKVQNAVIESGRGFVFRKKTQNCVPLGIGGINKRNRSGKWMTFMKKVKKAMTNEREFKM